MNAVIALCHFCEMHGPTVVMCTQPLHKNSATEVTKSRTIPENCSEDGASSSSRRASVAASETDLTELDTFEVQDSFTSSTCTACRSFNKPNNGFVTYGDEGELWFLTLQYPHNPEVFTFLRQACVRSLSSEISPGREGPILFGDEHHGYVYSYTFYLKDNEARGLQRWYSIVVLSMDKLSLTQSWPFLTRSSRSLVMQLQGQAERTYATDQADKPARTARLGSASAINPENFRRQRRGRAMRSLPDLTSDTEIFRFLHEHFTHLLQLGGNQMCETLLEGSPSCHYPTDSQGTVENEEECEFLSVDSSATSRVRSATSRVRSSTGGSSSLDPSLPDAEHGVLDYPKILPHFDGIVHLYKAMGKQAFRRLAYHAIVGNQIIVRGYHDFLVTSVINALEVLTPVGCHKSMKFSTVYEEPWTCSILGLHADATFPDHIISSADYFFVDLLAAKMNEMNVNKYKIITPNLTLPHVKLPTYLLRVEQILQEPEITEDVAVELITNQHDRIMSKVKVLYKLFRTEPRNSDELPAVMDLLHIPGEDSGVMKFWMTALSSEYKAHLKESSLPFPLSLPTSLKVPLEEESRTPDEQVFQSMDKSPTSKEFLYITESHFSTK